jgi:hypothetical protein
VLAKLASLAELYIVSFADREVILRMLQLVGALHHFEEASEHVFGWEELRGKATKGELIASLMRERGWHRDEVLFLDDQVDNVRSALPFCRVFWACGEGLTEDELLSLRRCGGTSLEFATPGSIDRVVCQRDLDAASTSTWSNRSGVPCWSSDEEVETSLISVGKPGQKRVSWSLD